MIVVKMKKYLTNYVRRQFYFIAYNGLQVYLVRDFTDELT